MSELPPGLVWKWKMRSCFSHDVEALVGQRRVSSSHESGSGLPPSRNVVFSATTRDSLASFSALRVISALRGRNETQIAARMRSFVVAASMTTSLRSNEISWTGTP